MVGVLNNLLLKTKCLLLKKKKKKPDLLVIQFCVDKNVQFVKTFSLSNRGLQLRGDDGDYDDDEKWVDAVENRTNVVRVPCFFVHD